MNKTIRIYSSLLLSLVLLGACSKDQSEPQGSPSNSQEITYNGPQVALSADSEVDLSLLGQQEQSSRVSYTASAEGALTLKLPNEGLTMPVHCIIKSTDATQPTTYVTLNWVRRGVNGLYYDYKQKAFNLETNTNIYQGEWYIAGMIGGSLNTSTGAISFAPTKLMRGVTDGQVVDIDAPFYFSWQRLKVVEVNGQPSLRVEPTVTFKPLGTLFRHNISNDMYNAWDVSSIKIITNTFTFDGAFTFPRVGQDPSWEPKETAGTYTPEQMRLGFPEQGWSYTYTLSTSATTTVAERLPVATPATPEGGAKTMGNNQRYYVSWGMPIETVPSGATPHTVIYGDMTAVSATTNAPVVRSRNTEYHIFFSDLKPEKGKSYLVRSVIRRPPLALESFAEYNLAGPKMLATSHGFLESNGGTNQAYYFSVPNYMETNALANFVQDNLPAGWRLPETGEAWAVMPALEIGVISSDKANPYVLTGGSKDREQFRLAYKPDRNALYGAYYTMHYWEAPGDESMSEELPVRVYGLRALTVTQRTESNLFMSAWKYEYRKNISLESGIEAPAVVIHARYLGPVYGQTGSYTTIAQYAELFREIAQEEWWNKQSVPADYEAVRSFPLTGYVHSDKEYLVGKHGVLMLQDIVRAGQPTAPYFRPEKMGVKTNVDLFYYKATNGVTSPYPDDAEGDYPTMNATFYPLAKKLKLAVRPFKPHDYNKPYLERRPRP